MHLTQWAIKNFSVQVFAVQLIPVNTVSRRNASGFLKLKTFQSGHKAASRGPKPLCFRGFETFQVKSDNAFETIAMPFAGDDLAVSGKHGGADASFH
jgi:hypothetical protein